MTIKKKTSRKNKSSNIPIVAPAVAPNNQPFNPYGPPLKPASSDGEPKLKKNANIFQRITYFLHNNILAINSSQVFSGIMIIMMNLGSKYVTIELSKSSAEYLKLSVTRQLMIFVLAWMGSRNIYIALGLTAVLVILTDHLFNHDSQFCIVPHEYRVLKNVIDTNGDGVISKEELDNAINILEKANKEKQMKIQKEALTTLQNSPTM